jgi:Flp pilus assembly protein TadD
LPVLASCRDEPAPAPSRPPASALPSGAAAAASGQVPITTSSHWALAAFMQGRDYADNAHESDAIERFGEAIWRDPKLAVAYAYLGYYQHGAEGATSMHQALMLEEGLPEAERLLIEELAALRAGNNEKAKTLATRVAELYPTDWHAQLDLGNRLFDEHKYAEAEQAFRKAAAFGPGAAVVFNDLGYVDLVQHRFEAAVVEFRKYAELRPDEPNTFDSIGETQMAMGQLDDAEKSFRKAADMKFSYAWSGVAEARFLRSDYAGGMEALGRSRDAALLQTDKLDVDAAAIWATLAEHKPSDALARVDALEKEAKAHQLGDRYAAAPAYRAAVLLDQNKAKEALEELDKATQRLGKAANSPRSMLPVRRLTLVLRAIAEARLGKGPDAEKTAAELAALAKEAPAQADYQSMAPFGHGAAALAKGDRKEAIARFQECPGEDLLCRRELYLAQQQNGDEAGAEATRAAITKINLRDPVYVYVRSRILATK